MFYLETMGDATREGIPANFGDKMLAIYWMFLLEDGERKVIVDTGPADPDFGIKYHHDYRRTRDQDPITALENIGIAADEISIVINTHLHWDHCGANDRFPNAAIYVQGAELLEALRCTPAHRVFYTPVDVHPAWLRAMPRTIALEGDAQIAPGLRVLTVPGHTDGYQVVVADTDRGRPVVVAGDIIPYFANYAPKDGGTPIPSGIHMSGMRDYMASLQRIRDLDPIWVLPGVDPLVGQRSVYP